MALIDFTIKVTFISDWHVGLGEGQPGNLDSLVRRDRSGLPFVPGKTLTGMLRDGCETMALGLDDGKPGKWSACVEALFGDQPARPGATGDAPPLPARLSVRPAAFPKAFAAVLVRHPALMSALTFAKPGVEIDPSSGAAKRRHFRMEEMVRGGCVLDAGASLNSARIDDDTSLALRALLWAGAKLVRRIGGKRRRGAGRCSVAIDSGINQTTLLNRLKNKAPETIARPDECDLPVSARSSSRVGKGVVAGPLTGTPTDDWFVVPFSVRLLTPVVIPAGVLGNSVRTHDHIPGTQLLGALSRALTSLKVDGLQQAIAAGDLQVLNAYPTIAGERGLPLPLSIQHSKEAKGLDADLPDGSKSHFVNLAAAEKPGLLYRSHRRGYFHGVDSSTLPAFAEAARTQVTHSTVDDDKQRPTTEVGGVFTYEALAAGGTFVSEVRCRGPIWSRLIQSDPAWWTRISGEHRIGIAKKDDYGRVVVTPATGGPASQTEMIDAGATDRRLTLWLTSDLLLRDSRLRPSLEVEDVKQLLEGCLNATPSVSGLKLTLKATNAFARLRRTDGWHVRWQLPRPSYVGLQAGSLLQFDLEHDVDLKQLEAALKGIEQSGLGDRRAEGFGELRINHQLASSPYSGRAPRLVLKEASATGATQSLQNPAGPTDSFAKNIEREAWRTQIARDALLWAIDTETRRRGLGWEWGKPANSQLGTLKSLVQMLKAAAGSGASHAERMTTWVKEAVKAEKWPAAAGQRLSALMTDRDAAWTHFDSASWPTIGADRHDALRKELWAEAVSALMFAAIQAERRHREIPQQINASAEVTL